MRKSDLLFLAVLAVVPVQLGKFFWPQFSYVLGLRIDYLALTLYLSDLVVIGYFLVFVFKNLLAGQRTRKNLQKIILPKNDLLIAFLIFNLYLIFNAAYVSISPWVSLWFSLKFLEVSILAIMASIAFSNEKLARSIRLVLTFSLIWQSALIMLQFSFQRSLGLWFLGERSFSSSTVAIAHFQILSTQYLRPYGTFPHPNVAAAFLVIYLAILASYKLPMVPSIFSVLAVLISHSQAALLALLASVISKTRKIKYLIIEGVLLVLFLWIFFKVLIQSQIASVAERIVLAQAAFDMAKVHPVLGIGSGNFIFELAKLNLISIAEIRLLQPVHNVFLLILAENGIIGLLLFALLLWLILKNATTRSKIALFIILMLFFSFDHFLWTLQQGRLLLAIAIGYIASQERLVREKAKFG